MDRGRAPLECKYECKAQESIFGDVCGEGFMAASGQVYLHRLRKYIGAYLIHLQGDVDAIIFSAGMGENSALLRGRALEGLQVMPDLHVLFHTNSYFELD